MQFVAPYSPSPVIQSKRANQAASTTNRDTNNESHKNQQQTHQKNNWTLQSTIKTILKSTCLTRDSEPGALNTNNNAQVHFNAHRRSMEIRNLETSLDYKELLYKLLITGDSSVGKTSFVQSYAHGKTPGNYKMTLGGKDLNHYTVTNVKYTILLTKQVCIAH